jgi:hypothetical protein
MIISGNPKWLTLIYGCGGGISLKDASESIMVEYWLRSFSPWLASILLDVAMGGDVVQDLAQVIFVISKNPYSTKPTVILNFSMPNLCLLWPTVEVETVWDRFPQYLACVWFLR